MKKIINSGLLIPLKELDTLCELFSFFTPVTKDHAKPVCRWWNDLLTKDKQNVRQIKKNNDSQENLNLLYKKMIIFDDILTNRLLSLKRKMEILASRINTEEIKSKKRNLSLVNEISNLSLNLTEEKEWSGGFPKINDLQFKVWKTLVTKKLNGNEIKIYIPSYQSNYQHIEVNFYDFRIVTLWKYQGTFSLNMQRFSPNVRTTVYYPLIGLDSDKITIDRRIILNTIINGETDFLKTKEKIISHFEKNFSKNDWFLFDEREV
jgi:hypothetical protein